MMRKQDGFSLVELMVAMVVFMFVIVAATGIFIPLVGQFKQQSKIAETNVAGIVGLELLRGDLEQAGIGLPGYFQNTISYNEAAGSPASAYNDAPANAPRAIVSGVNNTAGIVLGSNRLVVKSNGISGSDAAQKWTYIVNETAPTPKLWDRDNLKSGTDRVIVLNPNVVNERLMMVLVMDGSTFFTKYNTSFPANFSPGNFTTDPKTTFFIYGVDPAKDLKMPFNRADYYISTANVPSRCASGTGVLVKAVLDHQAGVDFPSQNITPLFDCVADMQVIFGLDIDNDGIIGTYSNSDGSTVVGATNVTGQNEGAGTSDVQQVLSAHSDLTDYRKALQEVRVYILAHEGQKDPRFTYNNSTIFVGDSTYIGASLGRSFDFAARGISEWKNYRWKLYTLIVKPQNTR
jgi:prepilin-type N-terminal cleavage/methylation domain-containing protein